MRKMIVGLLLLLAGSAPAQISMPNPIGGSGGGGVASGSPVSGCTAYSLVYINSAGNLACALAPVNGSVSTAGRGIFSVLDTISGSSANSNFLNITGTFPGTLSAETSGLLFNITADNDTQIQTGLKLLVSGGAANGSFITQALGVNQTGSVSPGWNSAVTGYSGMTTSAIAFGGLFVANTSSTNSVGVYGSADTDATTAYGVQGILQAAAPAYGALPTYGAAGTKAAGYFDNTSTTGNILVASDNGTATSITAASANVTILDGAQMRLGNQVLTSATMTPTIVGEARTVTHSYAWTNAMVTALGAALTGDITVATLPAKTQINNAYVVIDGAAAGPATVTVSCGDAIAGTPFINYIVASDAKAAANTVYGDAAAERGTSIDVEFYYLPSYTATTLVTCHFISTGANLNTVTGSSGRLVLTTTLLP